MRELVACRCCRSRCSSMHRYLLALPWACDSNRRTASCRVPLRWRRPRVPRSRSLEFAAAVHGEAARHDHPAGGSQGRCDRTLENAARFPLQVRVDEIPAAGQVFGHIRHPGGKRGRCLPVTLRNVESKLAAQQAAMPAKMLRLDADPAVIANWLRRVEQSMQPRGQMVEVPKGEQVDPAVAKPKLGTEEEDEDGASPYRWREDTGDKSVFDDGDAATRFSIAKPASRKTFEVAGSRSRKGLLRSGDRESEPRSVVWVANDPLCDDLCTGHRSFVHFKWGRDSSLVWVTPPSGWRAVPGAEWWFSVLQWRNPVAWHDRQRRCRHGCQSHGGSTRFGGVQLVFSKPTLCCGQEDSDLSFTLSGWDQGIDPGQFGLPLGSEYNSRHLPHRAGPFPVPGRVEQFR